MTTPDAIVTVTTRLDVHDGKLDDFRAGCDELVTLSADEDKCVFLQVAFDGQSCVTHEAYMDASGVLEHLRNVGPAMEKNLTMAEVTRLEICGPAGELDKLREPLAVYGPDFYATVFSFSR